MMKSSHYILLIVVVVLCSCAGNRIIRRERVFDKSIPRQSRDYRLGPSDEITIIFSSVNSNGEQTYLLEPGDRIGVSFYSNPELNRTVTILPDGKIHLPPVGEIPAAGKSASALAKDVTESFRETIHDPLTFINPIEVKQKTGEFIGIVEEMGSNRTTVTVSPDGTLFLPFLDTINAAGARFASIRDTIGSLYREGFSEIDVSVMLTKTRNNSVYVLGEVQNPGVYSIDEAMTILRVLASAELKMESARLGSVVVLSRTDDGRPIRRVVNVGKLLAFGNVDKDLQLNQYDVVYVPKSGISKANQFVDQYINGIVPDFLHFTFGTEAFRVNEN